MTYKIDFGGNIFATTELEGGDPPTGTAGGEILSKDFAFDYEYFRELANSPKVHILDIDEEYNFIIIDATNIVSVYREDGFEIPNAGPITILGFDEDKFDIHISRIDREFYMEEFPHHDEAYRTSFD